MTHRLTHRLTHRGSTLSAPAFALVLALVSSAVPASLAAQAPADSVIWYGRRVGYTGAFTEAVAIFTEGLRHHPNDTRLLRHRGHRYVSLRDFPRATDGTSGVAKFL